MWLFVSQVGLPGASGTDEPHVARSEPCVALCEPCVALCEPGGASGTDVFYSVVIQFHIMCIIGLTSPNMSGNE